DDDFSGPIGDHFARPVKGLEDFRSEKGLFIIVTSATNFLRQVSSAESMRHPAKGDFACQVVGRVTTGGGEHGWALGLYSPSENSNVAVRLSRDGQVEVGNFDWGRDGPTTTIAGPIRPPAVKSGRDFTRLLVICRGGRRLEIYANDFAIGPPVALKDRPLLS